MTNKREPPHHTLETPFHEAVLGAAKFLQCNVTEFANSLGTDESEIARWQLRPQDLDRYASIATTKFRLDQRLLQRRILITKLNNFTALLQKHFGSEIEVGNFLDRPWIQGESDSDSTSWRQLALQHQGLHDACDQLEQWLKNNIDFEEAA